MKYLITYITLSLSFISIAQQTTQDKTLKSLENKANNYVYQANKLNNDNKFVAAEMAYREAISTQPESITGTYNLAHAYYNKGNYEEALYRNKQAANNAKTKSEKHKAFHNIGNILMQNKQCKDAVEAYKNALRNNPNDDETRYNLALAKECAKQQEDEPQQKDDQGDNKEQEQQDQKSQDQQDKEDNKKQQNQNEQDQDQDQNKDNKGDQEQGEDQKNEDGNPKEQDQQQSDQGDNDKQPQKQQPKPGQLSPQQVKNLLQAMDNQEQKTQDKINAQKAKGVKIKTDKDW